MRPAELALIARLAIRHSVSPDAVRTILQALRSGGGTMAQFSHPDFGGMSQWSPGMTMTGDMFNNQLRAKLDAICSDLAAHLADIGLADSGRAIESGELNYRSTTQRSFWWPAHLGTPSAVGAQNDLRYAVFPRRLAIKDGEKVEVYDTGNHRIFGIAQAQGTGQSLVFTSQDGLVRVSDLPRVRD